MPHFFPPAVPPELWWVLATLLGALTAGTVVRLIGLRSAAVNGEAGSDAAKELAGKRLASLRTWWLVALAVVAATVGGIAVAAALFAVVSCLAFREMASLMRPQPLTSGLLPLGWTAITLGYIALVTTVDARVLLGLPLLGSVAASVYLATRSPLTDFLPQCAGFVYALCLTVTFPAFAVLMLWSEDPAAVYGGGLFLLLVGLTEINDIFAAIVGRRLGRRKLAPVLSPKKSWEGFFGGTLVTVMLAVGLGPWLTPLGSLELVQSGLIIAVAGTIGDLNMSAVKRCAGVKDSSDALPGQGGILDRIDSLTFSAPAFYLLLQTWD